MKRLLAGLLSLLLATYPAAAAVVTISVVDGGGVTRTFNVTTPTNITGALSWNNVICDQSAGATCASVGTAGAPSTNALTVQAVTLGNGTSANAERVTISSDSTGTVAVTNTGTFATQSVVTQATAANLNATVVGTGTFVTQSTVTQATSSNLKAQVDPLTPASWGIGSSTQNSAIVANGQLALGQFNTAPATITSGNMSPLQLDSVGNLLVKTTGFPTNQTTGTPIAVTTGGVTGTLPAGAVVVASNIGANNAYCKLGAAATTSDQFIAPSSWFAFTVGAATQLTCITSASTTTVNMVGGSGLPTGAGGGGGGGGGGGLSVIDQAAWTQAASAFTPGGGVFNDTATLTSGQQGTFRMTTKRAQIVDTDTTGNALYTAVTSSIVAGTNRIGYTSDDPCSQLTKTNFAFATSAGTFQLVAPSGATQVYVCSFSLIAAAAATVNLVGGTGVSCATGTPLAAIGSTTPSAGMVLAANGGLTFGNGGASVTRTTTAGHGLCLIQPGTTALAGNITYVQQ